jgi:hypothetical protein
MENQKNNFKLRTDLAYDSVSLCSSKVINGLKETKINNLKVELKNETDINRKKELMDMITNIKRGSGYNGK